MSVYTGVLYLTHPGLAALQLLLAVLIPMTRSTGVQDGDMTPGELSVGASNWLLLYQSQWS
ncbi:hypothetical protein AB0K51_32650 [Kitasatospora sp. NPDC049285]|uniref:hypothetical protein n=1 Tax=Kitasatospora sp. NPDC049285 TaxID=3157096 RepID=UPI003428B580